MTLHTNNVVGIIHTGDRWPWIGPYGPMPYYYPPRPTFKPLPAAWVCPRCSKVNAPHVDQCPCPTTEWTSDQIVLNEDLSGK